MENRAIRAKPRQRQVARASVHRQQPPVRRSGWQLHLWPVRHLRCPIRLASHGAPEQHANLRVSFQVLQPRATGVAV